MPSAIGIGNFLDNWLKGRTHTSDAWWQINASDGTVHAVYTSENRSGSAVDVEHPVIDDSGAYIAFMNAADASLWMLHLPIEQGATSTMTH